MAADGPLVVAHRGASHAAPEHTLAAYRNAIEAGADALECDVRLTSDGHLVCLHDRRIDRTSTGTGVVSDLELARLATLDFAAWRGAPDPADVGVLTFDRLLQLIIEAPRRVQLHVETKHPTRYAGLVEQKLVALLERRGLADAGPDPLVSVMSFAPLALRRIRLLAPGLPTVLLVRDKTYPAWREGLLPPGVGIAGPSIRTIRRHPRYVSRLRERGHRVHVWTVDARRDVDLVLDLGVDAIITNRPREVLQRIGRV